MDSSLGIFEMIMIKFLGYGLRYGLGYTLGYGLWPRKWSIECVHTSRSVRIPTNTYL